MSGCWGSRGRVGANLMLSKILLHCPVVILSGLARRKARQTEKASLYQLSQRPRVSEELRQAHDLLVHIPLAQLHCAVVLIAPKHSRG